MYIYTYYIYSNLPKELNLKAKDEYEMNEMDFLFAITMLNLFHTYSRFNKDFKI